MSLRNHGTQVRDTIDKMAKNVTKTTNLWQTLVNQNTNLISIGKTNKKKQLSVLKHAKLSTGMSKAS